LFVHYVGVSFAKQWGGTVGALSRMQAIAADRKKQHASGPRPSKVSVGRHRAGQQAASPIVLEDFLLTLGQHRASLAFEANFISRDCISQCRRLGNLDAQTRHSGTWRESRPNADHPSSLQDLS